MKALSIRQPWAWLIVNGYKTVENRSRHLGHPKGAILIHASSRMSMADYEACKLFLQSSEVLRPILDVLPDPSGLLFGGIVGQAEINAVIENWPGIFNEGTPESQWYTGDIGYWLTRAKPLPFKEYKGRLGFFDVHDGEVPA